MRIEKISDRQIKCTLNQKDLQDREIRISELAYGTDKAKALFRDMMQQASYEFGFEVDDRPVMIEAIPMSADTLILLVTKIGEDVDELDTRFSQFTSPDDDSYYENGYDFSDSLIDEDTFDFDDDSDGEDSAYGGIGFKDDDDFMSLTEVLGMEPKPVSHPDSTVSDSENDIIRHYKFDSMDKLTKVADILYHKYDGDNTIYKNPKKSEYILILHRSGLPSGKFMSIGHVISEYGSPIKDSYAAIPYYDEHFSVIIRGNALQTLGRL